MGVGFYQVYTTKAAPFLLYERASEMIPTFTFNKE